MSHCTECHRRAEDMPCLAYLCNTEIKHYWLTLPKWLSTNNHSALFQLSLDMLLWNFLYAIGSGCRYSHTSPCTVIMQQQFELGGWHTNNFSSQMVFNGAPVLFMYDRDIDSNNNRYSMIGQSIIHKVKPSLRWWRTTPIIKSFVLGSRYFYCKPMQADFR